MTKKAKVVMLCGKGDCCPKVSIYEEQVRIEDDRGAKVILTRQQYELFKSKVKAGEM